LSAKQWVEQAIVAVRQKDWKNARLYFGAALDGEAEGDTSFGLGDAAFSSIRVLSDSLFAAGGTAYEQGDLDAAVSAYMQVIKVDSERTDAYTLLGLIRADQGASSHAKQYLFDALMVDVAYVPALSILGSVFQEGQNLDTALALYRQAWALEPTASGVELFMGQVYLMQGNRDSARVVLSRVVQREPNNSQARELLNEAGGQEL
ncbi:MAG: tetratricopeptide repeat protein, partial [Candidatus Latescibacterota bacterium]